ncbi:MAG TPA: hypothetical protein VEY12_13130, partial [Thermoplasmata archaeon]|nr:hypothetical protein [Thermoplasmata archaeon]
MDRAYARLRSTSKEERLFGAMVLVIWIHVADAALEGQGFGVAGPPVVLIAALVLLGFAFAAFLWRGRVA